MKLILILLLSAIFLQAKTCSEKEVNNLPACIQQMITDYQNRPIQNPPATIFEYDYQGQRVFYIQPPCCDQLSKLYDANCNFICSPDGGFTGKGDGKCPDFHDLKKNEKVIWKDPRSQEN